MKHSLFMLRFLRILTPNQQLFMFEALHLHQTFSDYMFDWYPQFGISHSEILIHIWNVISLSNFHKLCVKAKVLRWKAQSCKAEFTKGRIIWLAEKPIRPRTHLG